MKHWWFCAFDFVSYHISHDVPISPLPLSGLIRMVWRLSSTPRFWPKQLWWVEDLGSLKEHKQCSFVNAMSFRYVLNIKRQILSYGRGYPHVHAKMYESSGQLESGPRRNPCQLLHRCACWKYLYFGNLMKSYSLCPGQSPSSALLYQTLLITLQIIEIQKISGDKVQWSADVNSWCVPQSLILI